MKDKSILEILLLSEKRRDILLDLRSGPKTIDDLKTDLECKSSPVMVQIRILMHHRLIEEKDGYYSLTKLSEILLPEMSRIIDLFETLDAPDNYWSRMDIQAIPPHLLDLLDEIGKISVRIPEKAYIFECSDDFVRDLKDSSSIMEISSIFKNVYVQEYVRLAEDGIPVSLIFSSEVAKRLEDEYPRIFCRLMRLDNVRFFFTDDIRFASCTVTDRFMSLSLFTKRGYYYNHDLISYKKSAIEWGTDLFLYYRGTASVRKVKG
ncbi:MAG: winged helix-turn-helix domain-containing protein [Methanosarcinaceae archaeon]|nr:winged helix-turn-helix domain-containing protein [Methanosarcinaceae archaeon]